MPLIQRPQTLAAMVLITARLTPGSLEQTLADDREEAPPTIDTELTGDAYFVQYTRALVYYQEKGTHKRHLRAVWHELNDLNAPAPSNLAVGVGVFIVTLIGMTEKAKNFGIVDMAIEDFLTQLEYDGQICAPAVDTVRKLREMVASAKEGDAGSAENEDDAESAESENNGDDEDENLDVDDGLEDGAGGDAAEATADY